MDKEKRKVVQSMIFPLIFLILIWAVKIFEISSGIELTFLGVYPLKASGLIGIITSPLIHGNFSHLIANSLPILILGSSVFFFYREIAFRIFLLIYFLAGIWLWFLARDNSYHIGASGLIYGLGAFLFLSGILRRDTRLMAVSLVVIFIYGSMIWGIFPDFFPNRNISWEGHLTGMLAGIILAVYYRKRGPQRKMYSWEFEDEEDDNESENGIMSHNDDTSKEENNPVDIKYHYKPGKEVD